MKNLPKDVLFLIAFTIFISIGISLTYINKSKQPEQATSSSISNYRYPTVSENTATNFITSDNVNYQHFSMPEPFASKVPFAFTPAALMQMMNTMMNTMKMTQMMHQISTMPSQMMNSTMWINPHGMLPKSAANPLQEPMDPQEYKKWYEQQLELQQYTK